MTPGKPRRDDPVDRAASRYIDLFAGRSDDFYFYSTFDQHDTPARRQLTPDDIVRGLRGSGPTISILFLRDDNTAKVAAVDADGVDGWEVILAIAGALLANGIKCAVERSRRGGHLWIASDEPIPAFVIRHALQVAITRAGHDPADPKIEVRPDTDEKRSPYGGKQLRGPMMPHRETGEAWPLLDPLTLEPLGSDWSEVVGRFPVADLEAIISLASIWKPPADRPRLDRTPNRKQSHGYGKVAAFNAAVTVWDVLEKWHPGLLRGQAARQARCPFHDDRHASLSIYAAGTKVKCHADGCILASRGPETAYGLALLCKEVGR